MFTLSEAFREAVSRDFEPWRLEVREKDALPADERDVRDSVPEDERADDERDGCADVEDVRERVV